MIHKGVFDSYRFYYVDFHVRMGITSLLTTTCTTSICLVILLLHHSHLQRFIITVSLMITSLPRTKSKAFTHSHHNYPSTKLYQNHFIAVTYPSPFPVPQCVSTWSSTTDQTLSLWHDSSLDKKPRYSSGKHRSGELSV